MFEQTISSLQNFTNFSDELKTLAKNDGISIKLAGLQSKNKLSFLHLPNGELLRCFAYIQEISHQYFQDYGAPRLHFCYCDDLDMAVKSKNPHLILIRTNRNNFAFNVYQGHTLTGSFCDYPLPLCGKCTHIFKTYINTKSTFVDSQQFEKLVFASLE